MNGTLHGAFCSHHSRSIRLGILQGEQIISRKGTSALRTGSLPIAIFQQRDARILFSNAMRNSPVLPV
jgi:hypothetical protein